jgi:hypothetical protein
MRAHDLVNALTTAGALMSYSRPRVSDDNPFSESLFKTIKYDPACPDWFNSIDHARQWTQDFLHAYATEHRHSGLGRHTPHPFTTAPPTTSASAAKSASTSTGPSTPSASETAHRTTTLTKNRNQHPPVVSGRLTTSV